MAGPRESRLLVGPEHHEVEEEGHREKLSSRGKRFFKSTVIALSPKRSDRSLKELPPLPTSTTPTGAMPRPTLDPVRTAVEVSSYAPNLTKRDIWAIFDEFHIADFELPSALSFSVPLRVKIEVSGAGEADRAVQQLDGIVVGAKQISVKKIERTSYGEREVVADEIIHETTIQILNTARVYYPQYASKMLQVRECMTATVHYAFLQARPQVTVDSTHEVYAKTKKNKADWQLIATGLASTQDKEGRYMAMENLRQIVAEQGRAMQAWARWEGSSCLNYNLCEFDFGKVNADPENDAAPMEYDGRGIGYAR